MSLKGRIPGVSSNGDHKSLKEIDDEEVIDEAIKILQLTGEDTTTEAIEKQANYLLEIQEEDEGKYKVGFVQDREEATVADQNLVAPRAMKEESDIFGMGYLRRNEKYVRILAITDYPRYIGPGVLEPLYTTHANVRITQHIEPRDVQSALKKLKRKLNRTMARLARARSKGQYDTQEDEEIQLNVRNLIWEIITGKTKLFDQTVYIEVVADTEDELDQITKNIIGVLNRGNIDADSVGRYQTEAQKAMCPAAEDPLKSNRQLMQEETLAAMFPFIEPETVNADGIIYGKDQSGKPVMLDPYNLSSFIEIIAGKQGSGKSFAKMWEILLIKYKNPTYPIWAIDPKEGFAALAREIGGQVIEFGGDTTINPLAISKTAIDNIEDPYQDKCRTVMGMYRLHFGDEMDKEIAGHLWRVIHLAYLKYGITPDPETHTKQPPTIQDHIDIVDALRKEKAPTDFITLEPGAEENEDEVRRQIATIQNRMTAKDAELAAYVFNGLEPFNRGGVNYNLNGRTNVDLSNSFVVFDMSMFADSQQAPLMMHVLMDTIYQRTSRSPQEDMVIFDEVHYILQNRPALEALNLWARHHRHSRTRLSLISQTADEFLVDKSDDNLRTEIYKTADIKRLFYHQNVSDVMADFHNFTQRERQFLTRARQGENSETSQCLMEATGHGKIPINIDTSDYAIAVVDEDESGWEYLYENGIIDDEILRNLVEEDKHIEYNIPDFVLAKAGIRTTDASQLAGA